MVLLNNPLTTEGIYMLGTDLKPLACFKAGWPVLKPASPVTSRLAGFKAGQGAPPALYPYG